MWCLSSNDCFSPSEDLLETADSPWDSHLQISDSSADYPLFKYSPSKYLLEATV